MGDPVTGWWRRNAVSLVALAVLAPATAVAISLGVWAEEGGKRASEEITVAPGGVIDLVGSRIGPAEAAFTDEAESAPPGARVVAVTVDVAPGPDGIACTGLVLREQATGRQWDEDSASSVGVPYDPDRTTYCDQAQTAPFTLSLFYLVPDDAAGPFTLEFVSGPALPTFAGFVLEP
ncbi:hypothetical protein [Microbacterium sp. No. 7]|uniref:hypothetical protein n=1 Tax=Microbacterium sp. No. 7 TaxID=1714373 RepID=UPI0006D19790|nr:hypothetical protein [Microbacterium sp. No. 7]ALJ20025.1 hypothetical protein AOA12_08930 [Microbacterium sp. No. 7]